MRTDRIIRQVQVFVPLGNTSKLREFSKKSLGQQFRPVIPKGEMNSLVGEVTDGMVHVKRRLQSMVPKNAQDNMPYNTRRKRFEAAVPTIILLREGTPDNPLLRVRFSRDSSPENCITLIDMPVGDIIKQTGRFKQTLNNAMKQLGNLKWFCNN